MSAAWNRSRPGSRPPGNAGGLVSSGYESVDGMSDEPEANPHLRDALLIARQQWQLNEIRELVRAFARNGTSTAPPEAYAYLELMVDAIVDDPEQVMALNADVSRLLNDGGTTFDPDGRQAG